MKPSVTATYSSKQSKIVRANLRKRDLERQEADYSKLSKYSKEDLVEEMHLLKSRCAKASISTDCLRYFSPIVCTVNKKVLVDEYSFLCCHNKCGFFDLSSCAAGLGCCHHIFRLSPGKQYSVNGVLRYYFQRSDSWDKPLSSDRPIIAMNWSQHTVTKTMTNHALLKGINTFFSNTIKNHYNNQHGLADLPTCVAPVKFLKQLKLEKPHLYNPLSILPFLSVKDGEDFISDDPKKFRKIISQLEQYPYLAHYNAFIVQVKKRKRK